VHVRAKAAFFEAKRLAESRWAFICSALVQVTSSLTTLAITIYLLRALTKTEFGEYGVIFAASLLCLGIANSLILIQMTVLSPRKPEKLRASYYKRIFWLCLLLCPLPMLSVSVPGVFIWGYPAPANALLIATGFTLLSTSSVLRDCLLRIYFCTGQEGRAVALSLTIAITTAVIFYLQYISNQKITSVSAVLMTSAGQISGVIVGYLRLPTSKKHRRPASALRRDTLELWTGGKWAGLTALVSWLHGQSYVYASALMIGPQAVAYANAARIFVSPFQAFLASVSRVMLPKLAKLREPSEIIKTAVTYSRNLLVLLAAYSAFCFLAYAVKPEITGSYSGRTFEIALACWILILAAQALKEPPSIASQSMGKFRSVFASYSLAASISITLSFALAPGLGLFGPLIAVAAGEFALCITLWARLWSKSRKAAPAQ